MKETTITVNDLWKRYHLGDIDAGSLKEDVQRWWDRRVLRKASALPLIQENDLSGIQQGSEFWALQGIEFTVKKGEVLGIIGKNGAGKSTLLKILSRISRPTRGTIRGTGSIASLLEVGTGFHEELTGRENIFLNGNILGMSNREIRGKFDDIVDFSGISRFIDTPVKRYSSGMYVRLAFAVAAHLNPDILVLDEVLSVGDEEFQERCLAKIHQVAVSQGCTIIYVSHNIPTVEQLCSRAILLNQGRISEQGSPKKVIDAYYGLLGKRQFFQSWDDHTEGPGNDTIRIEEVSLHPRLTSPDAEIDVRTPLGITFRFRLLVPGIDLSVGIHLFSRTTEECIFDVPSPSRVLDAGFYEGRSEIPGSLLNDGEYYVSIIFVKDTLDQIFYLEKCLCFEVKDYRGNIRFQGKWMGHVRPRFPISITPQSPSTHA